MRIHHLTLETSAQLDEMIDRQRRALNDSDNRRALGRVLARAKADIDAAMEKAASDILVEMGVQGE